MKKYFIVVMTALLMMVMVIPVSASTINLSKSKTTMYVGDTCKLKVSGSTKSIRWSSSKKSVATVSKKGVVTAKKRGTATITAKVGKKKLKCKVTVKRIASGAMKRLSGTWSTASSSMYDGRHPESTVQFSSKYCTCHYYGGGTYKYKIYAIKKTSYGYFIRLKNSRGNKFGYRLRFSSPDVLEYVETWSTTSSKGYSGGSSLWR